MLKIFVLLMLFFTSVANADDAYLDAPYGNLIHPITSDTDFGQNASLAIRSSDTERLIHYQSPVRTQGRRGTCSFFSSTALMESLLILNKGFSPDVDLSEEWLAYTVLSKKDKEGSDSNTDLQAMVKFGLPNETSMPYIGRTWESIYSSNLARERCEAVPAALLKACLISHLDPRLLEASDSELLEIDSQLYSPDFYLARKEASAFAENLAHVNKKSFLVPTEKEIKETLLANTPVILSVVFYFGAWNHRSAPELGISRNMDHWYQGIVGYPERGSVDKRNSLKKFSGHSVLIVGYDDDVEVTTKVKMQDGSAKTFTYKGVYYFKNSWGTSSFGKNTKINGNPYPGYGMITQRYAHELGAFYKLQL